MSDLYRRWLRLAFLTLSAGLSAFCFSLQTAVSGTDAISQKDWLSAWAGAGIAIATTLSAGLSETPMARPQDPRPPRAPHG